jgi:tetratricopeptide (TPR) repeat protein
MKQAVLPNNDRSRNIWPWVLIILGVIVILVSAVLWLNDRATSGKNTEPVESVKESNPTSDFVSLALTLAQAGDVEGALEALDIAIAANPGQAAEAYYYRGLIHAEEGDPNAALEDFNQGITANQHMPELFAARGTTYASLGRPATALDDFDKAIQLAPNHAATYVNRGQSYSNMGEPELAMQDFNKALELDAELVAAYFNRGVLYLEMAEPQAALDDFNSCIELSPAAPAPYFNRAIAYMELNDLETAAADLETYIGMAEDETGRHQAEALLSSMTEYEESSHISGE